MQSADLSVKERAVLFALLGEAREVTNSQLADRAGFRLDGKERRKLNDLKLSTFEVLQSVARCDYLSVGGPA
jgi:hypothetical protein